MRTIIVITVVLWVVAIFAIKRNPDDMAICVVFGFVSGFCYARSKEINQRRDALSGAHGGQK